MRLKKYFFSVFFIIVLLLQTSYSQDFNSLYGKYQIKDFFHFRDGIKSYNSENGKWQKPYLEALSDCIFGDFAKSEKNIDYLLENFSSEIPDSLMKDLYLKKYYDNAFLFEYKKAYETAELLLSKYSKFLTKNEMETVPDDIIMFKSLIDAPPLNIKKGETDLKLKIKKDMAGLWNVPVKVNDTDFEFVFDTGADFPVLVESVANKLGLKISDKEFSVGTGTDKKVKSKVAVVKSLKIGNITLENVVFYIMKDEDFTIGPYKILGIIGAPIIRAFEEVRFTKDNELIIPVLPGNDMIRNIAYDQYTPIIQVLYLNDSLNFVFDSGNDAFTLYRPFLTKYESEITKKYTLRKLSLGGAGGIIETDGYLLDKINIISGNSNGELKNIMLLANSLSESQTFFHGNLGQAYIKQFNTLILNYKNMYIEFQN
jgi:clan AA aspartic protease (TIGR02281 family)